MALFPGKIGRLALMVALGLTGPRASAGIDDNLNGLGDVWEAAFGEGMVPGNDDDGDGFTNIQESAAGTDPKSGTAFPRIVEVRRDTAESVTERWPTVAGIRYQTLASVNLTQWAPVGQPVIGTGEPRELTFNLAETFTGGGAARSRWTGLSGGDLGSLKNYASSGTPVPQLEDRAWSLDYPQTSPNLENFGQWIRGWIVAPLTGNYTFWLASDDSAEFWISNSSLPAGKALACSVSDYTDRNQWTKYNSQKSALIPLVAGQAYYFETFHREYGSGDHLAVAWTRPGMAAETREIIGGQHLSSTGQSLASLLNGGQRLFFKLEADQTDSDGDGVSDYEEALLGLNGAMIASTPRVPDLEAARKTLASPSTVTLGVSAHRAYEAEGTPAVFRVFRSGGIKPIEVPYTVSGTAVSGQDFTPLSGVAKIPAGSRSVDIMVHPVADGLLEPAEAVILTLGGASTFELGSPAEASVTIDDSADVLFVAQLRAASGVPSGGAGTAAVRRAGNSLGGRVSLSFGGLTGPETGAEIFVSETGSGGPAVFVFPLHQVPGLDWDFAAAGGFSTAQILAALNEGKLWVRVLTGDPASPELTGRLLPSPGWETMPPPVVPPPAPTHATDIAEAARFLTQATFGPKESELAALVGNGYAPWIDAQLALPPSYHLEDMRTRRDYLLGKGDEAGGWQGPRNETWWQKALTAPDQLRQRMALALSQIFVISQFGALDGEHIGTTMYYDMLLEHAFGNYRDLLEDVTLSPSMGIYLSMIRNKKPDPVTGHEPDENYARESMQLFSVGLSRMHTDGSLMLDAEGMPIPTYTQDDTVALAHVFTGWGPHYDDADPPRWENGNIADRDGWFQYAYPIPVKPMTFYANFHDNEDRTILGGTVIPGNAGGIARMEQALDTIFNHPNVGPFMARQLIQKFITSNPSPGYIHRVASVFNNNGSGVRGDLGATLKAVLLDYEARALSVRSSLTYGKPSEPLIRASRVLRVIPPVVPVTTNPAWMAIRDDWFFINLQYEMPEQAPLLSPSVFNFYQPGYSNPGPVSQAGLLSPEFQIFQETTAIRQANLHHIYLSWGIWASETTGPIQPDYTALVAVLNTPNKTPLEEQELLIDWLDDRFLFGAMSPELRATIRSSFAALPTWYDYSDEYQKGRARIAAYLVLNSPEYFAQK